KKIKCPKCANVFEAPAAKAVAKSTAKPAEVKPVDPNDDFMDRNPYGVTTEQEESEEGIREKRRAATGLIRDRFKKSARGPAQREVTRPANFLMASGVFTCIASLTLAVCAVWPLIFRDITTDKPAEGQKYADFEKEQAAKGIQVSLS